MHKIWKLMLVITGIIASLAFIVMATLAIIGGILTRPDYQEPWSTTYAKQFDDPRLKLVAVGILAANGHNMQPWKLRLDKADKHSFYLYVDSAKLTPAVDPLYRQTLVSQGTFLAYVQVAAQNLGIKTNLSLFPYGAYDETHLTRSMDTKPVAKITISGTTVKNSSLYSYTFLADTNRSAYKPNQLTKSQIGVLQSLSTPPAVAVNIYQDQTNRTTLGNFANAGTQIESGVQRISTETAEVFRSNEKQKNKYRYGFSVEGQGTTGFMKYLLQGIITIDPALMNAQASAKNDTALTRNAVAHTPAYATITTSDNTRLSQVEAGMIYSKLVLTSHSLGLVMQPPSQVLEEYPEMARQYDLITGQYAPPGGTVQMLFRIGQPTINYPVSMRQSVSSFFTN